MTYSKSQFEMPDGKYVARFMGVTMRDEEPGAKPRLGADGKPLPPAMMWNFEIAEGPEAGKRSDRLTGRIASGKSGCAKMLAAISDTILSDGIEVDLDRFVGKFYRVTVQENRISDNPCPVLIPNYQPGPQPPQARSGPPDEDTIPIGRPDPAAKWDYYDGQRWVPGLTTDQIFTHLAHTGVAPDAIWVRPTGTKDKKIAQDYGFVDEPAPSETLDTVF